MLGRFKQLQNKINNKAGYRINPYLRIRDQDAREKSWFKDLRWWIIVSGLTLRKQEWRWSGEFDLFIKFPLDLVDLNPPTRSCLAPRASHTPRFITSQDFHRLEKWLKQNKSLISQPGWMKRFHLAREISLRAILQTTWYVYNGTLTLRVTVGSRWALEIRCPSSVLVRKKRRRMFVALVNSCSAGE